MYTAVTFIDMDYDDIDPNYELVWTEGDIYVIFDGIYFMGVYDYDEIDLTSSDQYITINLSDEYVYGFYEDFEDGTADDWVASDDRWTVSGGKYLMEGVYNNPPDPPYSEDVPAWSLYDMFVKDNITDFTFSVQLDQTQGDFANGDWGILFRFDYETTSGYALWVWAGDWWGLETVDNGTFYPIFEEDTFNPGDEVSVECIGNMLYVYINGVEEWSYDLSTDPMIPVYTQGYVGLYGWDDSRVLVDNIFVFDEAWRMYHQ